MKLKLLQMNKWNFYQLSEISCIVNNNIPLLFSKATMKRANIILDFTNNIALVLSNTVDLISILLKD